MAENVQEDYAGLKVAQLKVRPAFAENLFLPTRSLESFARCRTF